MQTSGTAVVVDVVVFVFVVVVVVVVVDDDVVVVVVIVVIEAGMAVVSVGDVIAVVDIVDHVGIVVVVTVFIVTINAPMIMTINRIAARFIHAVKVIPESNSLSTSMSLPVCLLFLILLRTLLWLFNFTETGCFSWISTTTEADDIFSICS